MVGPSQSRPDAKRTRRSRRGSIRSTDAARSPCPPAGTVHCGVDSAAPGNPAAGACCLRSVTPGRGSGTMVRDAGMRSADSGTHGAHVLPWGGCDGFQCRRAVRGRGSLITDSRRLRGTGLRILASTRHRLRWDNPWVTAAGIRPVPIRTVGAVEVLVHPSSSVARDGGAERA